MKKLYLVAIASLFMLSGCFNKDHEPRQYSNTTSFVSTYAGIKVFGYQNGEYKKAQFFSPMGITKSKDNTLYVADTYNHAIRKIYNGKVSTLAGSFSNIDDFGKPIGGYLDGPTNKALFNHPTDIVVADNGTVYVTDTNNGAIRRITTNGQVETFVKNLNYPSHLAMDEDNTLYVTEKLAHRILKIDVNGKILILAGGNYQAKNDWLIGSFKDAKGEKAQFNEPTGIAWSEKGYLIVSDTGNQRIRKVQLDGTVTTIAGGGQELLDNSPYITGDYKEGDALQARFNFPQGVAILKDQSIVIADTLNHRIRILYPDGQVSTLAGVGTNGITNGNGTKAEFDGPTDILVGNNDIYIADQYNNSIRLLSFTNNEVIK